MLSRADPEVLQRGAFGVLPDAWRINGFINMALIFVAVFLGLVLWSFTAYHLSLLITGFTTKERLNIAWRHIT